MANGHVKIHDVFNNHTGLNSSINCDAKATSDSDDMEDSVELRILRAYFNKRQPKRTSPAQHRQTRVTGGTDDNKLSPQTETQEKKKKTKKMKMNLFPKLLSCIRSGKQEREEPYNTRPDDGVEVRSLDPPIGTAEVVTYLVEEEEDDLKDVEVASRLTDIADEIPFVPPYIETDAAEDENVERIIGLLLRESGDRLDERELKGSGIPIEPFSDYNFFRMLMQTLLMRMGLRSPDPDSPGPKASPKTQIAVICEATTRLSALHTLPTNRLLGHGARYLQQYYSSWAQQQGGYEEAFHTDDEEDIE
ncbi:apoptosis facilitator Bcl-2-like protein 14 [Pseudochaenichthys georgianus]|uniref:apoptosis facilitator Bcl-2-like protein 14 n=1 Tax=Pseudochaenichthys georgianus TaxID=52239 RepID=UPI00146D02D4|nr:apoptosis facilitator Bcl-2-like protein 14 [Pseudochaenichthys georgianus]